MLVCNVDWKAFSRKIYAELKMNFTDVFLDPTITATSTDQARVSWIDQAVNGRESMSQKWFALNDGTLCDGTFYCCPSTEELASFNEFGWWSETVSDSSGNITLSDPLTVEYSSRGVGSYLVAFDDKRDEYAIDFTVKFYDGVSLLYTSTITGNTESNLLTVIPFQLAVDKVVLDVTKWSNTISSVKVAEFTTQVSKTYDLSDIVNFNTVEQREVSTDNSIPQGNISSSELDFSILNIDREFDYNNVNSSLYGLIKNNARVSLSVGMDYLGSIEYVPVFSGFVNAWSVPENELVVSASARDRLDVMRQTKITNSQITLNTTFYDWFKWVLNNAGLADYEFLIDSDFSTSLYTVPVGWFEAISHKQALEDLARGCSAVVYQDRKGIIQVRPLSFFSMVSSETYTRDDYTNKDNQPLFNNIANRVRVKTYPLVLVTGILLYETSDDSLFEIGATTSATETIFYNDTPATNQVVSINPAVSGLSITSQTHYSWGSVVTVNNTGTAKTYKLESNGDFYEVKGQQVVTEYDQTSIDENGEQELLWSDAQWLQTKDLAEIVASSVLASYKDPQKDIQISLTNAGNPCLELGDRITVTDLYTDTEYNIIETNIDFNGGLSISHKGRK